VASLSQGRTAAAQCGLFTHKSVPVIFEPPCNINTWSQQRSQHGENIVNKIHHKHYSAVCCLFIHYGYD